MSDVVIIGSGISGMLVAHELCSESVSVTIIERTTETGQEASWAGGGIISPLYPWHYDEAITRLASWSQEIYPVLCASLFDATGVDPQWTQSGLLIMTEETQQAEQWADRFDRTLQVVSGQEVHDIEPAFARGDGRGVWLPQIAQVRNPRLMKALKLYLQQQGVRFVTATEAQGFILDQQRVQGVRTSQGDVFSDRVVVAGGAWSQSLLATVGQEVPRIVPVQGQMLLFKAIPELVQRIVLSEQRYVIPRRDGRILVGSTLERVGFEKATSEAARADLYAAALNLIPTLGDWPVEHHWAGLRPGSPQGIPYIYEHPEITGLYVNCGHYRNGVVLGPASAHLLVDQLLGRSPTFPLGPYSLKNRPPDDEID